MLSREKSFDPRANRKMTFLGISHTKETNNEIASSDCGFWREVESDADHKEMTRTYGCDDYLSRWLPNIKQRDEAPRVRLEKKPDKEQPSRLFKSPCHHHEGKTLRENKMQQDPGKKTYFEAIKCSPMKLRQSIAAFKRPKLDESFTLKPKNNTTLNPNPSNAPEAKEQTTALSTSIESMEDSIQNTAEDDKRVETKTIKPGVVEMQHDEMGLLGSLCFRKSLPENFYAEKMYTPCNMIGGKLRKVRRETGGDLLSARRHSKELLVRCESIMIYPKVLVNQKDKFATSGKQQSAKDNQQQQSDVSKLQKYSNEFKKPDKPKEAWNDITQSPVNSKSSDANYTRLPQLNSKDQGTAKRFNSPETPLDHDSKQTPLNHDRKETPVVEVHTIQNCTRPPSIESQITKTPASTKIIIPFGENEKQSGVKSRSKSENTGGHLKGTPMKSRYFVHETSTMQKVQEVVPLKEEGVEWSAGESDVEGKPTKLRFLKESSKVNEQSQSTHITVGVRQDEMPRELAVMPRELAVRTQYLTVNITNTRRFRIPTGIENSELFIGRENYPPKTKTGPYRFAYTQKGLSEYGKNFDGVKQNLGRPTVPLKIGGKGLLKARLARNEDVSLTEDESKKRVQFLVNNSRYFTRE